MNAAAPVSGMHPLRALGEIAEFLNAARRDLAPAERVSGPYPYLTALGQQAAIDRYLFDESLLLLAEAHAPAPAGGADKPPAQRVRGRAWVGKGVHVLRPGAELDLDYLYHIVCARVLDLIAGSAKRTRLGKAQAAALLVPCPGLDEQRRIAALLEHATRMRDQRRRAQTDLGVFPKMFFLEHFGDPAGNPRRWPSLPFGRLGENQDRQRQPAARVPRKREAPHAFPCYGQNGIEGWTDQPGFEGARLIVSEIGANLRDRSEPVARVADGRFAVNRNAHVIAANGIAELRFLECALELLELRPYLSGGAQPRLTRAALERISIPLPPLPLQREFASLVAQVERLRALQSASALKLEELCASLRRDALRGSL